MKTWLYVLSIIVALLVVFVAYLYCNSSHDCNNASLMVSALCALVTTLVGWNIFQFIDLKQYKKDVAGLSEELKREINYAHNKMDYNDGMASCFRASTHAVLLGVNGDANHKFLMLIHGCNGIKILSNMQEFDTCENCAFTMLDTMSHSRNTKMTKENTEAIIDVIYSISNLDRIKNLQKILDELKASL